MLNALPIHNDRPDAARFRNPNGTLMKLGNFAALDPSYSGKGLTAGNKLEQVIWDEFSRDRERLSAVARTIRSQFADGRPTAQVAESLDEDEKEFVEGAVVYRLHRRRERNPELVRRAKAHALKTYGVLRCAVCNFDFGSAYGVLGDGFIEVHHTTPLSELASERKTKLDEVTLLCSNCHRMVHRKRPWLKVTELGTLVQWK